MSEKQLWPVPADWYKKRYSFGCGRTDICVDSFRPATKEFVRGVSRQIEWDMRGDCGWGSNKEHDPWVHICRSCAVKLGIIW